MPSVRRNESRLLYLASRCSLSVHVLLGMNHVLHQGAVYVNAIFSPWKNCHMVFM